MEYVFPVVITISGNIRITASCEEQAKEMAKALNERGIEASEIEDTTTSSEIFIDEMEDNK